MKKILSIIVLVISITVSAQVGIGIAAPDASAILHLESSTKGFLPPRLTTAEMTTLKNVPAKLGLIVYCTDCTDCNGNGGLYAFNGTDFMPQCASGTAGPTLNTGDNVPGVFYTPVSVRDSDFGAGSSLPQCTAAFSNGNLARLANDADVQTVLTDGLFTTGIHSQGSNPNQYITFVFDQARDISGVKISGVTNYTCLPAGRNNIVDNVDIDYLDAATGEWVRWEQFASLSPSISNTALTDYSTAFTNLFNVSAVRIEIGSVNVGIGEFYVVSQ